MQDNGQVGFSLLEVLLALGLVGIALPAILTLWISQIAALDTSANMIKLLNAEKNFLAITSGDNFRPGESGTMFLMKTLKTVAGENIYKTCLSTDAVHLPQDGEIFVISFAKDTKSSLDDACSLYDCSLRLAMATSENSLKINANSPKHSFRNFYYERIEM
ncbi:MAG: prepilin-type N-terminal cleavage/methylation domain-containing protein [Puniceicoccales bacterium]|jgi:prepilin-type N-terminal cleavage/methylation domain-containing protein|nr:prepilin-type N-terminal cleavage/methylation domain-containing protein [Puniceicoccales bacterium]